MLNCGKREEKMKIKTYYLILVLSAGFFIAAVPARPEQSLPSDKPPLINQSHPAFAGIDKLHVAVLRYGDRSVEDMPVWNQFESNVKEKLRRAGIKLETPTADNILNIPELRIYISTLNLKDSQQYIFHIRIASARGVCLKNKPNPTFKAEIWQATPLMQVVSAENMPAKITDLVLEQVDDFINIYKATNLTGQQLSDESINVTDSSVVTEKQTDVAEYKYIASNSSNIFHKPDCRWAQNISKRNLVTYKTREEAIKAGKRPCKTCNP
jgi:hypothetical protein